MSNFKCGLRRFDGHGTSSYRPTNTAATKEMESAFSKMMRERELQDASLKALPSAKPSSLQHGKKDSGCFSKRDVEPVKQVQLTQIPKKGLKEEPEQQEPNAVGECYSLSDSPSKKTE